MNKVFQRFTNLFVPVIEDKSNHIYKYGYNNTLPNDLVKYINDSGIAKKCINKVATYISADGFSDPAAKNFKVNPIQTADEILNLIRFDVAFFKGITALVGRNPDGTIRSIKHVPFQYVRKTLRGDFLVNMTLGTKDYKKDANKYYAPYYGVKATPQQMATLVNEYKNSGEIAYIYEATPDNPHYPVPDYYAAIEDVRTSSELQKFDLEAVLNGFVPSAILTIVGEIDDKNEDEDGKTQRQYLTEALETFTGNAKNADGLSNRNSLMVIGAKNKDEVPVLQAFDAKAIIDASISKRDAVDRAVCRLFGVHPVLVGFSDAAVLGNTQAIANASLELNNNVNPYQRMIERMMRGFFPNMDWTLTKFNPINYIPDAILQDLTQNERRELFGFPPLNTNRNV